MKFYLKIIIQTQRESSTFTNNKTLNGFIKKCTCKKSIVPIVCQFSSGRRKTITAPLYLLTLVKICVRLSAKFITLHCTMEGFHANWFGGTRIVKDKICDAECFRLHIDWLHHYYRCGWCRIQVLWFGWRIDAKTCHWMALCSATIHLDQWRGIHLCMVLRE